MGAAVWLLLNAVQTVLLAAWSAGWITVALLVAVVTRSRRVPLAMARGIWAPGILWLSGARLEVEGAERAGLEGPLLIVSNHQSLLDVPALFAALPANIRFLAKGELRRIPFLAWYISAMGMMFVDRDADESGRSAVDGMVELLRRGVRMVVFPEGTRSTDGRLQTFRTGAFVAAIQAQVPVLPVAVAGTVKVLRIGGLRFRPGRVRVAVGEPLPTAGLGVEDRAALAERARRRIGELVGDGVSPDRSPGR